MARQWLCEARSATLEGAAQKLRTVSFISFFRLKEGPAFIRGYIRFDVIIKHAVLITMFPEWTFVQRKRGSDFNAWLNDWLVGEGNEVEQGIFIPNGGNLIEYRASLQRERKVLLEQNEALKNEVKGLKRTLENQDKALQARKRRKIVKKSPWLFEEFLLNRSEYEAKGEDEAFWKLVWEDDQDREGPSDEIDTGL